MKRDRVIATAIGAAAAVYFASLVRYGLHLGEDGDVVYLIYRAYSGQQPYLDFASGYAPGYFEGSAALMHLFGASILVLRWAMVLVNSFSVAALYLLGRTVLPPPLALVPALGFVAIMPVFAGEFATFNVPYAAWYGVLTWCASLLALRPSLRGHSPLWAGLAGSIAAVGCAIKPNTGAFNFAALTLIVLFTGVPRGVWPRLLWWSALAGIFVCLSAIFGFRLANRDARLLLWPVFALMLLCASRSHETRVASRIAGAFVPLLLLLFAGFSLVTAPWVLHSLIILGRERFLHDVLFIGSGHELFFYLPIRDIGAWDAALFIAGLGLLAAGRLVDHEVLPARALVAGMVLLVVGALVSFFVFAPMPEGFHRAVESRLQHLAFGAAILANYGGVLLILRSRRLDHVVLAVSAPLMFLSIYPRSDFFHWVLSAPLTLLLGILLIWRAVQPVFAQALGRRGGAFAAAAPAFGLAAVLLAPAVALSARLNAYSAEVAHLPIEGADIVMETGRRARLDDLASLTTYIRAHSTEGETLLGFPNLHLVNYLTDRHVPGRYGSFHPGWPDHEIEAGIVTALEENRTPLIAVNHDQQLFMGNAPLYYFLLRQYVLSHYEKTATFGSYDVFARTDGSSGATRPTSLPAGRDNPTGEALTTNVEGALARIDACPPAMAAAETDRPESARALSPCWQRSVPDATQERAVSLLRGTHDPAGVLPLAAALRDGALGRRATLLAVRALGDLADARAFADMVEAREHLDGRVRDELSTSLLNIAGRSFIESWLFEPRDNGEAALAGDPAMATLAVQWLGDPDPRLQYAGAWLAGLTREPTTRPGLRRMLAGDDIAMQGMAATSLLRQGAPEGVGEALIAALKHDEMFAPAPLLLWAQTQGTSGVSILAESYTKGTSRQRETIAYVAAALGDPALREPLRAGLSDPDPRARRAAAWALEHLPT